MEDNEISSMDDTLWSPYLDCDISPIQNQYNHLPLQHDHEIELASYYALTPTVTSPELLSASHTGVCSSAPQPEEGSNMGTNQEDTEQQQISNVTDQEDIEYRQTKSYFEGFPPGYCFQPTDVELIRCYLQRKIKGQPLPPNLINEVNLYKEYPETVTARYRQYGEKERYFFTPRDRKYKNGERPNRAAKDGYWKATGADRQIKENGSIIGLKKTLVFYDGKPPNGTKNNWIMHEYRTVDQPRQRLNADDMKLDDFVLCRIYKKERSSNKSQEGNNSQEGEES